MAGAEEVVNLEPGHWIHVLASAVPGLLAFHEPLGPLGTRELNMTVPASLGCCALPRNKIQVLFVFTTPPRPLLNGGGPLWIE